MSNIDLLEYRINRLEKAEEDKQKIIEGIAKELNLFIQESKLHNAQQDNKIRNIMLIGTAIGTVVGTVVLNVGMALFDNFLGG